MIRYKIAANGDFFVMKNVCIKIDTKFISLEDFFEASCKYIKKYALNTCY